ncbi:hypothetical protein VTO42DRAFT_7648 [Malbranchea cinnamomea]
MPPRQRPAPTFDDSRSEASSGPGGKQTSSKGRRTANQSSSNNATLNKDPKPSVPPPDAEEFEESRPQISWSTMPLSVLHDYRHAYNLPCPSAYSSQINSILLTQGIGLRSPTAIAARRAQLASSSRLTNAHPRAVRSAADATSTRPSATGSLPLAQTQVSRAHLPTDHAALHRIQGQGRVTKDQLAAAVRKHFNSVAISEQDVIARFLYKVREERKGRKFRLRFQP